MHYNLCIHINVVVFFKIVTQRSKTLIPMMPLFKTFWKTSSQNYFFSHLQAWLKTSISLLSIRISYQDSSSFFYSPDLAINVSQKWWKWLKLTFKLRNLSPLRIFRSMHACVCVCTCVFLQTSESSFKRRQRQKWLIFRASGGYGVATIWMTWYVCLKTSRVTF